MKVEIRRNRDISFELHGDFSALGELFPEPTDEQKKILEDGEKERQRIETEMWLYFEAHPTRDQLGNIISQETHEIGYDVVYDDTTGCAYAENMYVRPKKSEYEHGNNANTTKSI